MPRALKRCAKCDTLVRGQVYCNDCKPIGWTNGWTRTSTKQHKEWHKAVHDRAGWYCQLRYEDCQGTASHADHIVPISQGGAALDLGNGQAACKACHDEKSKSEQKSARSQRKSQTEGQGAPTPGPPLL